MAIVRLQDTELTDIGNSIRAKLGVATQYLPEEMAPAILTIPVIPPFEWGSETDAGAGTAQWWADLKTWIKGATTEELAGCVGKTKSITLTTPVLGITTHLVRCIGYNCNRDKNNPTANTLTFGTKSTLDTRLLFSSTTPYGKWSTSAARGFCIDYYNAFPGKPSICTVSIGTATKAVNTQNSSPVYTDETVFLPSEAEMSLVPGHVEGSSGFATSYKEFDQYNTSKTPYQYYTTATNRLKTRKDSGNSTNQMYWLRSMSYESQDNACYIYGNGYSYHFNGYNASRLLSPHFVI